MRALFFLFAALASADALAWTQIAEISEANPWKVSTVPGTSESCEYRLRITLASGKLRDEYIIPASQVLNSVGPRTGGETGDYHDLHFQFEIPATTLETFTRLGIWGVWENEAWYPHSYSARAAMKLRLSDRPGITGYAMELYDSAGKHLLNFRKEAKKYAVASYFERRCD